MKTPKPRPYIRSVIRRGSSYSKPRYTLTKIDQDGKRRRLTVSLVNADVLPLVEREFLKRGSAHPSAQSHHGESGGGG